MSAGTGTATKKMMVHLDMDQNQTKNFVVHNLAADPIGTMGQMYYNTSSKILKYYNGTQWIPLSTSTVTWRAIKMNNSEKLANTNSDPIDFYAGSGITLTWDETNKRITIASTVANPMNFKGTATATTTAGTTGTPYNPGTKAIGDTYKVIAGAGSNVELTVNTGSGTNANAKIGDTVICIDATNNYWTIIPSGDEPSGTVTSVGLSMPEEFSVSNSPVTTSGNLSVSRATGYDNPVYSFTYINASAITPVSDIATITLNNGSTFVETLPTGKMPDYNRATFEVYEKVTESDVDYWDKIECAIRVTYDDSPSQIATFKFNTSSNIAANSIKIVINAPLMQNYV